MKIYLIIKRWLKKSLPFSMMIALVLYCSLPPATCFAYEPLKQIPRWVNTSINKNNPPYYMTDRPSDNKTNLPRVAVLPSIEGDGVEGSFADAMVGVFLGCGHKVIERSQIFRILEEHHLSFTGILEKENLDLIGKIANIDAIVICSKSAVPLRNGYGTIIGQEANVNLRMIDIKTGAIMMSVSGRQPYGWADNDVANEIRQSIFEAVLDDLAIKGLLMPDQYEFEKNRREQEYKNYHNLTGRGEASEEQKATAVFSNVILVIVCVFALKWVYVDSWESKEKNNKYLKLLRFKF